MVKGLAVSVAAAAGVGATAAVLMRLFTSGAKASSADAIRVGLIGTGWALNVQVPQFKAVGLRIAGIYSRDQTRADTIAAEKGIDKGYSSVETMASSPDIDIISVVTPVYLHLAQATAVLEAGKHLLCDKPMTLNGEEAEKLLAVAKAHPEQVAIVDHELRFTPMLQEARRAVQSGAIGEVAFLTVTVSMPRPAERPWTWWADKAQGGGILGAVGSHVIDTLRFVLGAEVTGVSATLDTITPTLEGKPVTSDDYVSCQLKLASPKQTLIRAHITLTAAGSTKPTSVATFAGTKGYVIIDLNSSTSTVYDSNHKAVGGAAGEGSAFAATGTKLLGEALQKALGPAADLTALDVAAKIEDGVAVMYVMDAIHASSEAGGKWIAPKLIKK